MESDFIPYVAVRSVGDGKALVFAPHPDDEVFGCGGAIIRHIQQGNEVSVVIVTDGNHPVAEQQKKNNYSEIRKSESIAAAAILGYGTPEFLGYADRELQFNEELINHLQEIILSEQPSFIYIPAETEIHPDHIVLNKAVKRAACLFSEKVTLVFYEVGQMQKTNLLLDISDLHETLNRAMNCFSSQLKVQNYIYHINALHAYRTYTLGAEVKYAEAYYCKNENELIPEISSEEFEPEDIQHSPMGISEIHDYPLISVIVRTMHLPVLSEALDSISQQTYPNLEVIVIDARGKGKLSLTNKCGRFPLRVITQNKQLQRAAAANVGLASVSGELFCFLDEDDLLFPEHIAHLYRFLNDSHYVAAYSGINRVNGKGELLNVYNEDYNFQKLLLSNFIPIHALLFKASTIKNKCVFDEKFEIYEDWDFLIQVGLLGTLSHHNEISGIYRDFGNSGVFDDEIKINKFRNLVFEKWKLELPGEQYIDFIEYLSTLYLEDKNYFEGKYLEEKLKLDDMQKCMQFDNDGSYCLQIQNTSVLEAKEAEISLMKGKISTLEQQVESFKLQGATLSSRIHEKDLLLEERDLRLNEYRAYCEDFENKNVELHNQVNHLDSNLALLTNSRSWRWTKYLRSLRSKTLFKKIREKAIHFKIYRSGLFNKKYYLKNNPDLLKYNGSVLNHYLNHGGFEGRNPSPHFDTAYYLEQNPDVKKAEINPLVHYLRSGKTEGRGLYPKLKVQAKNIEYQQEMIVQEDENKIWQTLYGDFELNKNYNHQNITCIDKESGWIRGEIVNTIHLIKAPLRTALLPGEHNGVKSVYASLLNIPENEIKTTGLSDNVDYHWNFENRPPNFGHFSIIISQAMLEHLIDPYKHVRDLFDALEPGGHLILHTVIPGFQYHRYPIDCFRFFPDWFEEVAIRLGAIIADKYIGEQRILYRFCKVSS